MFKNIYVEIGILAYCEMQRYGENEIPNQMKTLWIVLMEESLSHLR